MMRNQWVKNIRDYFRQWESSTSSRRINRDTKSRTARIEKCAGEARRLGYILVKRDVYLRLQRELFELRSFKLKAELKEMGIELPVGSVVVPDGEGKACPSIGRCPGDSEGWLIFLVWSSLNGMNVGTGSSERIPELRRVV